MKKKRTISPLTALLAGLLGLCIGIGGTLAFVEASIGKDGAAILQARQYISREFVGDYDEEAYHHAVLNTMVEALGDRWSYYLTPEQYEKVMANRNNSYVGIGVTVSGEEPADGIAILSVTPDTPASEGGLLAGEIIRAVDGVTITPDNRQECSDAIAGKAGTKVKLEIEAADGTRRTVELTRREIHQRNVGWELLEGDVGYLQLVNFYSGAADLAKTGIDELVEQGAQALVLDVRNNPGGYMNELVEILDYLLPEGELLHTEYENGRKKTYTSDANCVSLPMAVLINADSYSAAEFLAAQLRESAGAILVGEPTCGKGFSQQIFRLRDGSALNISTARYYTGGGVSLIGTGLKPDLELSLGEEAMEDFLNGVLSWEQDAQLQAAMEALGQKG